MNTTPIIIEGIFEVPTSAVWEAITDKDKMKQWYFDLEAFRPDVGFEFRFNGGPDGRVYLHVCKVTEAVPGKKLTYSWRYEGYAGISFVSFELFEEDNKTVVRLTHEGLETFPVTEFNDFAKENFVLGWAHIIGTSLKGYLENTAQ